MHAHEEAFFATVSHSLTDTSKQAIGALLAAAQATPEPLPDNAPVSGRVTFNDLKADPGRAGLDSVLTEIAKLQCIDRLQLPANLFAGALARQLVPYRQRAASEPPGELNIFYGKGGEVASNQLEDQELSVLSLHLLQNCMVYVNTLMIQSVLADPAWRKRLKAEDYRALTPLIYTHVNPYGGFDLDMGRRLPIGEGPAPASRMVEPRRKQA